MAHMALYRKWRPLTFEDVVEQRHIVTTLKNSIKNNTISHAYLFCGTRGTGKTTLAKILARAINCIDSKDGSPCNQCIVCKGILNGSIIDVIEIDAASNNGVDDVREIKEAVMYVPAVAKYKVYIIDEVHMLSTGAFNALLKTLEEPPENVVFILATTEPHKLPTTILSRCQRFDFKRITLAGLVSRIKSIAIDCGVGVDESALNLIARLSEGGMRDAISLLDQCISRGGESVSIEDVIEVSGLTASETVNSFAHAIVNNDVQKALLSIKTAVDEGRDIQPFCAQLIDWFRNLMLIKTGGEALSLVELSEDEQNPLRQVAKDINFDRILGIIKELSETEARLKWSENQRVLFEVAAVKLCTWVDNSEGAELGNEGISELYLRITELEKRLEKLQQGTNQNLGNEKRYPTVQKNPVSKQVVTSDKEIREPIKADFKNRQLKGWADIVDCVRLSGKMKVYAYLMDTQCLMLEDGVASIIVSSEDGLKKTVLSINDSIEDIKEAIKSVTGSEYAVKITEETSIQITKPEIDHEIDKKIQIDDKNNIPLDIKE